MSEPIYTSLVGPTSGPEYRAKARRSPLFGLRALAGFLWLGSVAFAPACHRQAEQANKPAALGHSKDRRAVDVVTQHIAPADVPIWLEAIGTATPLSSVSVEAQVDGRLLTVDFVEGQHVEQNQVLARIDPRPFAIARAAAQAALVRDQATLKNLERNVTRLHGLRAQNMVSEQQLADQVASGAALTASVLADRAALDDAALKLDYATIRAPKAGTVGLKRLDAGNLVRAGSGNALCTINQLAPIGVLFALPQQDLPALRRALAAGPCRVEVTARDDDAAVSLGEVSLLDNQIDPKSGTVRLKAVVPNEGHTLWPNQFVRVRVLTEVAKGAYAIPASAIIDLDRETFVYVAKEGHAHKVNVDVVRWRGTDAMLREPLAVSSELIVEGHHRLKDGDPIATPATKAKGEAQAASPAQAAP